MGVCKRQGRLLTAIKDSFARRRWPAWTTATEGESDSESEEERGRDRAGKRVSVVLRWSKGTVCIGGGWSGFFFTIAHQIYFGM